MPVGKKGATIKAVRDLTGATFRIISHDELPEARVCVRGPTKDVITHAAEVVRSVVHEGVMYVDEEKLASIKLASVEAKTGAKIRLRKTGERIGVMVLIIGEAEQIQEARSLINEGIYQYRALADVTRKQEKTRRREEDKQEKTRRRREATEEQRQCIRQATATKGRDEPFKE